MTPRTFLTLLAVAVLPSSVGAQSGSSAVAPPPQGGEAYGDVRECWRFGFGVWEPALDWRAAGHQGGSPAEYLESVRRGEAKRPSAAAPGNATWSATAADTALLLFPDWWPAGIAVRLQPVPATVDTIRGIATALVANGHATNPVSRIIAIRRSCGGGAPR